MRLNFWLIISLITPLGSAFSQNKELSYSKKLTLLAGLSQPLFLKGANLAVTYTTNRLIFEYSHGINLNYSEVLSSDYKDNVLSIKSPYSTGAGLGYRFFANQKLGMDLRAEAKIHSYEVKLNSKQFTKYINLDLGGGLYWQYHPFGKRTNGMEGIVIEPSIRYWANVKSSLKENYSYKTNDGRSLTHKPYPLNLFANISIGFTF